jgi:hypothetical protein
MIVNESKTQGFVKVGTIRTICNPDVPGTLAADSESINDDLCALDGNVCHHQTYSTTS